MPINFLSYVKIEVAGKSLVVAASTEVFKGAYQPDEPNWPTHDQSISVTSAGGLPAIDAVIIFVRISSQPSVCRLSLMPVCAVKRSVMSFGNVAHGGSKTVT